MPLESVKMKNSKIGLRHVLSWPKLGLEPKFYESGTFGGFGKREHTDRQTDRQDSCLINIDLCIQYRLLLYSISVNRVWIDWLYFLWKWWLVTWQLIVHFVYETFLFHFYTSQVVGNRNIDVKSRGHCSHQYAQLDSIKQ